MAVKGTRGDAIVTHGESISEISETTSEGPYIKYVGEGPECFC